MLATKIICPHCQAGMNSNKPVPPGTSVTCPKCRSVFRTKATGSAIAAGPPPVPADPATGIQKPPTPSASVLSLPQTNPSLENPGGKSKRVLVVTGLLVALAVGLAGTLYILLGNKGSGESGTNDGQDTELVLNLKKGAKPKARPLIELTKDEEKTVQTLVEKGVGWLRKKQNKDGTWPPYNGHHGSWPDGVTALAALTLLSCGVQADDPVIVQAAQRIRKAGMGLNRTYEVALAILFLDRLNKPQEDRTLMESLVSRLVAGQSSSGGWGYNCQPLVEKDQLALFGALSRRGAQPSGGQGQGTPPGQQPKGQGQQPKPQGDDGLPPTVKGLGVFAPFPPKGDPAWRGQGDNSNTQFAILALWTARKHKLPVEAALLRTVQRFKECQNGDGSWSYGGTGTVIPEPTMTCAGLLACAMDIGLAPVTERRTGRPEDDAAIKKALVHVAKFLKDVPKDAAKDGQQPPPKAKGKNSLPPLYFIWSVERVGVLFQLKAIAGKDWFRWGLHLLEEHQRADGHWRDNFGASTDVVDTCFALLFLQRVNLAEDLSDKLMELGLVVMDLPPPNTKP